VASRTLNSPVRPPGRYSIVQNRSHQKSGARENFAQRQGEEWARSPRACFTWHTAQRFFRADTTPTWSSWCRIGGLWRRTDPRTERLQTSGWATGARVRDPHGKHFPDSQLSALTITEARSTDGTPTAGPRPRGEHVGSRRPTQVLRRTRVGLHASRCLHGHGRSAGAAVTPARHSSRLGIDVVEHSPEIAC